MMIARSNIDLLDGHVARDPLMAWQAAYKLLFQGILGPEHLAADPEAFAARPRAELVSHKPPG